MAALDDRDVNNRGGEIGLLCGLPRVPLAGEPRLLHYSYGK